MMRRALKTGISAAVLGIFALVLSGVLFCSVSSAGMPGMQGMDANQCPAALELHFETIQTLTGSPLKFLMILALGALAGVVAFTIVLAESALARRVQTPRFPSAPYWLSECFRSGILHPKIYG